MFGILTGVISRNGFLKHRPASLNWIKRIKTIEKLKKFHSHPFHHIYLGLKPRCFNDYGYRATSGGEGFCEEVIYSERWDARLIPRKSYSAGEESVCFFS